MAKEGIQGEVVEILEDEGPEEGEIEDDTSEEDNAKNYGFCPTISAQNSKGTKCYHSPSTSTAEMHSLKSQLHSEDKTEQSWGSSGRHAYKYYVTHEKPVREPYSRLKKTDINSDHRGMNFNELLVDYKTSKHGSEGNFHEKENRHYGKDVRVDSSRKLVSGLNDGLTEKIKRSRKRKHRRSPSRSPVSSDTDTGRRRKEIRTNRPKRKKKLVSGIRNHNESAAIFAKIRALKLGSVASEVRQPSLEIINVVSEGEQQANERNSKALISGNEGALIDKGNESQNSGKDLVSLQKGFNNCDSPNDTQATEMSKESECQGEDDDVQQLRMLCLQSAFRAKCLERKRRGHVIKKQSKKDGVCVASTCSSPDSILDNTVDLLEAAVEEAIASQSKETPPVSDSGLTVSYPSLSEVPLPPGEPQEVQSDVPSQVEDLTPVDMDLALTDEEEENNKLDFDENSAQLDGSSTLDDSIKICRIVEKTRNIPVTIGRQNIKSRQRLANNNQDASRRSNLLEVKTDANQREGSGVVASNLVTVTDTKMGSMIVLDEFGICSSPEICTFLEEDQTLSETSDAKSDFVSHGGQSCLSGNDIDEEDEELLRARLLLDISSRHMKLETVSSSALKSEDSKPQDFTVISNVNPVVETPQNITSCVTSPVHLNGKNCNVLLETAPSQESKTLTKRNAVERNQKQQMLIAVQKQRILASNQASVTALAKARLSKIANRGKYRRVNQNRLALVKKRSPGSLQVTVPGTATNSNKVINPMPQQQDRIVICLGEDSDDSDEDKSCAVKSGHRLPGKTNEMVAEKVKPNDSLPGNISVDFEKSVDLFLKEVRSVRELQSEIAVTTNEVDVTKKGKTQPQSFTPKARVIVNTNSRIQAAKAKLKSVTGLTPQAVRHLPVTQQAEYHRLKMQISILEKRRAAQASAKNDQNVVITSVGNSISEPLELATSSSLQSTEKNKEASASNILDSFSFVSSLKPKESERSIETLNNAESSKPSKKCKSDEEEDENLMREQLLRSRLQRKVAAAASALKTPLSAIKTTSCDTNSMSADKEQLISTSIHNHTKEVEIQLHNGDINSKEVREEMEKKDVSHVQITSCTSEKEDLSQKIIVPSIGTAGNEKKSVDDCDVKTSSKTEESIANVGTIISNASISSIAKEGVPNTLKDTSHKECSKLFVKSTDVSNSKNPIQTQDLILKRIDLHQNSDDVQENRIDVKTGTNSLTSPQTSSKALEVTKGSVSVAKPVINQDISESNASQLKDLENQLHSERNVAVKYLSELSQLLKKMEIEGERLKQKESAVKKLRAELSVAETSLDNQRIFVNQLAVKVSSTRERVTASRHKCTLLSRACLKLGTQMKQEEIAQGGQKTEYQVPIGGAELVKNQLSKVLCHTKQLKKSGLQVYRLAQGCNSKEGSMVKKRVKRYLTQPQATTHWTKLSVDKSNAKLVMSNSANAISKTVKHTRAGAVSLKKEVSSTLTKQDASTSGGVSQESLTAKQTDSLPKIDNVSHKITVASAETSIKENQVSNINSCVSNVEDGNVKLGSSGAAVNSAKGGSGSLAKSHEKPTTAVGLHSADASGTTSVSVEEKIALLKDYHSPLEPVPARNCSESLTVADTRSSKIESEDSLILDPNVILCPYDLMGVCEDEECSYQHQRRKGVLVAKS